jgi:putative toxin-antitoxin system antitoxin component (TIGR02293 family)
MPTTTRIFEIIGIDRTSPSDEQKTASYQIVRRGLPPSAFKQVASYYKLPESQMASLVGTSKRTIERLQKENKPLNANWSDRLYRLARVAAIAEQVFESSETAINWLKRPNRALSGVAPISLLDTDAGVEQVSQLLERIEYGVYS